MAEENQEAKTPFVPNPKELDGVPVRVWVVYACVSVQMMLMLLRFAAFIYQDLSSLIYLEEPHVVHNVKCRYSKDLIYTGCPPDMQTNQIYLDRNIIL